MTDHTDSEYQSAFMCTFPHCLDDYVHKAHTYTCVLLCTACEGLPLTTFQDKLLLPYKLDMADHDDACRIDPGDESAGFQPPPQGQAASGSAVQGI